MEKILTDINTNVINALNSSLKPLIDKIDESNKNSEVLNTILYNLPLHKELQEKFDVLKEEYTNLQINYNLLKKNYDNLVLANESKKILK